MDLDGNGKISFDEFYQWWHHGINNNLRNLVQLKMKAMRASIKLKNKLQKIGGITDAAQDQQVVDMNYLIQVGDEPPRSFLELTVVTGKESVDQQSDIVSGLDIAVKY